MDKNPLTSRKRKEPPATASTLTLQLEEKIHTRLSFPAGSPYDGLAYSTATAHAIAGLFSLRALASLRPYKEYLAIMTTHKYSSITSDSITTEFLSFILQLENVTLFSSQLSPVSLVATTAANASLYRLASFDRAHEQQHTSFPSH